ncbi:MAG: hypothetical protein IMY67_08080 [Bacteroidetes bacterium]|nr:hypothetical protein [Bacteroidota bacterium]
MKVIILMIASVSFLYGCAAVSFAPSSEGYNASIIASPNEIKVFRTEKPSKEYVEIGAINYPGGTDLDELIKVMKKEASKRGGNAIIDLKILSNGAVGTVVRIKK